MQHHFKLCFGLPGQTDVGCFSVRNYAGPSSVVCKMTHGNGTYTSVDNLRAFGRWLLETNFCAAEYEIEGDVYLP